MKFEIPFKFVVKFSLSRPLFLFDIETMVEADSSSRQDSADLCRSIFLFARNYSDFDRLEVWVQRLEITYLFDIRLLVRDACLCDLENLLLLQEMTLGPCFNESRRSNPKSNWRTIGLEGARAQVDCFSSA